MSTTQTPRDGDVTGKRLLAYAEWCPDAWIVKLSYCGNSSNIIDRVYRVAIFFSAEDAVDYARETVPIAHRQMYPLSQRDLALSFLAQSIRGADRAKLTQLWNEPGRWPGLNGLSEFIRRGGLDVSPDALSKMITDWVEYINDSCDYAYPTAHIYSRNGYSEYMSPHLYFRADAGFDFSVLSTV